MRKIDLTNILAALFMGFALAWATASFPLVYTQQQSYEIFSGQGDIPAEEDQSSGGPFNNTSEEKTEQINISLSEYLHHINELIHLSGKLHEHSCFHNCSAYVAFHGELHCPPPNPAMS